MELILVIVGCLGLVSLALLSRYLLKILTLLKELTVGFNNLQSTLVEFLPQSFDDVPISEMVKEVQRREFYFARGTQQLVDVIAAGVGKAFKK